MFDLEVRDDLKTIQATHPVSPSDTAASSVLDAGISSTVDACLASPVYQRTRAAALMPSANTLAIRVGVP